MTDEEAVERVADVARRLEIPKRENRWTHLSLCVIDAVFSIGANYAGTKRTVDAYADLAGLPHRLEPADQVAAGAWAGGEQPLSEMLAFVGLVGAEEFARRVNNRQRTSTRGGILKAEAVYRYAAALVEHHIERLVDVTELLTDVDRLAAVECSLSRVPGHGLHGVRMAYLWMLAGDDHHVKPDRMVLGWLRAVLGRASTPREATALLTDAAAVLHVTPWQLDHAIWTTQRTNHR